MVNINEIEISDDTYNKLSIEADVLISKNNITDEDLKYIISLFIINFKSILTIDLNNDDVIKIYLDRFIQFIKSNEIKILDKTIFDEFLRLNDLFYCSDCKEITLKIDSSVSYLIIEGNVINSYNHNKCPECNLNDNNLGYAVSSYLTQKFNISNLIFYKREKK